MSSQVYETDTHACSCDRRTTFLPTYRRLTGLLYRGTAQFSRNPFVAIQMWYSMDTCMRPLDCSSSLAHNVSKSQDVWAVYISTSSEKSQEQNRCIQHIKNIRVALPTVATFFFSRIGWEGVTSNSPQRFIRGQLFLRAGVALKRTTLFFCYCF